MLSRPITKISYECFSEYVHLSRFPLFRQKLTSNTNQSPDSPSFKVGLTAEEKKLYSQLFKSLDPENAGIITGERARTTFEKSGLPPSILGEIWQLADQSNLGFLTQFGFCYAMRLIGYTQAGHHPSPQLGDQPGPLPKFANLNLPAPRTSTGLQPQSTNNSFMQTQPSATIPQSTATQSTPQESITPISAQDYQKFSQLFIKTTGSPNTTLEGPIARDIFLKAKLLTSTLSQIWALVDRDNLGKLSLPGFVIAMHLIQGLLSGAVKQLPPFLPESIWKSVEPSESSLNSRQTSSSSYNHQQSPSPAPRVPANDGWVMTPDLWQQYGQIFNSLDKTNAGHLNPDEVASFLMTSKLGQEDLANVWDLSDIQNTGIFTKLEFAIALFLVRKRTAGEELPNIVPDTLVESIKQLHTPPPQSSSLPSYESKSVQPPAPAPIPAQTSAVASVAPPKKASAMDDLVDLFGPPSTRDITPAEKPQQTSKYQPPLRSETVSSDSLNTNLPRIRSNLTGSFKPTSSFGQSLIQNQPLESPREEKSLIGDDVHSGEPAPKANNYDVKSVPTPEPVLKKINYDALRAVPPPPPKKAPTASVPSFSPPVTQQTRTLSTQPSANNDLLAENSEISGQLSQATSDIANISNQVKSLTTQTTGLHDKKLRAEQELSKILQTKADIENKLKLLKTSYDNEVKQVEQVDATLQSAKEETEALRSEASISEAKLNHLSGQLHEQQVSVEDLQKTNSSLKEKLGYLNAEIVELEKQLESKTAENKVLSNQASVKKSQVQVAIVKTEELKNKIKELESSNIALQKEHDKAIEREREAEQERQVLAARQAEALKFKPETKSVAPVPVTSESQSKSLGSSSGPSGSTASSHGVAAGAALGATVAGAVGAVGAIGAHLLGSDDKGESEETDESSKNITSPEKESEALPTQNASESFPTSKEVVPPTQSQPFSVAALVDEVKEHPSADLTGVDDINEVDPSSNKFPDLGDADAKTDSIADKFPDLSTTDHDTNQTASSVATSSYKNTEEGETPITSPSNSEFQFPQGSNAGVAGGLVGLPGALMGIQRTDSLTSSVQNNAALSVRDDNIDEISDRETLENVAVGDRTPPESADTHAPSQPEDSSEGEKLSSGVESFEIVNAEEAREGHYSFNEGKQPADTGVPSETFVVNTLAAKDSTVDEEFPPIRELDYDESSSSSDNESHDEFDDAVDHLEGSHSVVAPSSNAKSTEPAAKDPEDEFGAAFDDLEPATQEKDLTPAQDGDLFDDFDDLEAAKVDNTVDEFEEQNESNFDLTNDFTETPFSRTNHPDFGSASQTVAAPKDSNDEWEQLFAGFGNHQIDAQPKQAVESAPTVGHVPADVHAPVNMHVPATVSSFNPVQEDAIQELVGMGFDQSTVVEALKKENWNIEAATNYLLDHA